MDATLFLILAVAILIGGLLVAGGALIGLRARRRGEAPAANDSFAPSRGESPPPAGPVEVASTPAPRAPSAAWLADWQRRLPPDVVVLNRDVVTGDWLVELEGQRYRHLGDVHDDKAASKILSALEGLKSFAGLSPAAGDSAAQASVPVSASAPLPPPIGPRKFRQAQYPAPEGSIIAQIETILQRELSLHPELKDRSIHMGATPDGSLLIEVDVNFYRAPDDIPDPTVRDIVMTAVRTWEKSN